MVLVALLVTTYLHYRKKRRDIQLSHSPQDGIPDSSEAWEKEKLRSSNDRLASSLFVGEPTVALPEGGGNAYRGLLWMKDKYEQYRDQTDRKIEKLKEELTRTEEKYLTLQAALSPLLREPNASQQSNTSQEPNASPQSNTSQPSNVPQQSNTPQQSNISLQSDIPSQSNSPQQPPIIQQPDWQSAATLTGESNLTEAALIEATQLPQRSIAEEQDLRIEGLQLELEQRIRDYHQLQYQYRDEQTQAAELSAQYAQAQELVKTRQFEIEELNTRLLQQQHKLTDLTFKLECNTQLLLRIHQELDSSLNERQSQEVSKIVGWA